jgi:hypothetical protein
MKIRLVGAELLHADGRTDIAKLIVTFETFTNAPKSYNFPNDVDKRKDKVFYCTYTEQDVRCYSLLFAYKQAL